MKYSIQISFLIISAMILYALVKDFDLSLLNKLSFLVLIQLFFLRVISFIIYNLSNFFLFRAFDKNINIIDLALINSSSTVSNYATPIKIGFPLQILLLKKILNISYKLSGIIIFLSVIMSIFIALFLSLSFIVTNPSKLSNVSLLSSEFILIGLGVIIFLLILFFSLSINIHRNAYITKLFKKLFELKENLLSLNIRYLIISFSLMLFGFFMNAWMINIILVEFNEDVSILNLFFIQGIPYLLAMVSMIPLGLGIKDASLTYLIVQTGVQSQTALLCAILMRILTSGFSIITGFFSINYLMKKNIFDKKIFKNFTIEDNN